MIQRLMKFAGVAGLALGLFVIGGCQGEKVDPYYREPNPKLFTLTPESELGTFQVAVGQHFNVNLYTNPYNGYHWAYKPAPKAIIEAEGTPTFIQLREDKEQPKFGMTNFEFVAKEKGAQDLRIVYYRPTLRSRHDERFYVVHLEVVDSPSTQPSGAAYFVVPPKGESLESYQKSERSAESTTTETPVPAAAPSTVPGVKGEPAPAPAGKNEPAPAPAEKPAAAALAPAPVEKKAVAAPAPAAVVAPTPRPAPAPAPAPVVQKSAAAPAPAAPVAPATTAPASKPVKKKPTMPTGGEGM